ncbi:MAG TPA: DUF2911 domain-containing protein [Bryobacteraceae bacterium]|nr:DUF2911 domain-containing protein [Bryobacteraceae bacterium]
MRLIGIAAAVLTLITVSGAQAQRGRFTSPQARVATTVGGAAFSVEYYAPSAHGRKIMGQLVPYGEVWCTGANIATEFNVGADIQIGSLKLPRGAYSIWTLPTEKEWTLIINKETGQFHLNYKADLDFGRTKMNLKTLAEPVETFRVELRDDGGSKGTLALLWENTEASIPFTVSKK